jgi:hypothetical protein
VVIDLELNSFIIGISIRKMSTGQDRHYLYLCQIPGCGAQLRRSQYSRHMHDVHAIYNTTTFSLLAYRRKRGGIKYGKCGCCGLDGKYDVVRRHWEAGCEMP